MYLRKVEGPRVVRLDDGSYLTQADLPARDVKRWNAGRKAIVARAVLGGLITRADAEERWGISGGELASWLAAFSDIGQGGLKTRTLVIRGRAERRKA